MSSEKQNNLELGGKN